jgi:hypothetical protein
LEVKHKRHKGKEEKLDGEIKEKHKAKILRNMVRTDFSVKYEMQSKHLTVEYVIRTMCAA